MPGFEVIGNEEFENVKKVFDHGGILFRHGFDHLRNELYMVKDFEKAFARRMGSSRALAVSSGTAALRVALAGLGIGEGNEVITQSFTFVATVEAIIESRAIPVCCEIDDTLNMDPNDLEKRITNKTKAIIVVHMLGSPARLREIKEIADRHQIPLIEDTAWGCGGSLHGIPLGNWGSIGTFSFDFAKTMTCGEGGMLIFKDEAVADRATAWHDHGHENNPKLPRWEDSRSSSGFNFRMMELQGAVGLVQLEKLDNVVKIQRKNAAAIRNALDGLPIEFRAAPEGAYETSDALIFFVDDHLTAARCRELLLSEGLGTKILPEAYTWHFAGSWCHMKELMQAHQNNLENSFPKSVSLLKRSVSLPISLNMSSEVPDKIRKVLDKVFTQK
jgi:8-amino-3,8-dideoxy-alpha-D-manno-octulosonate transaminase